MIRNKAIRCTVGLVVLAAVAIVFCLVAGEPRHQGRSLDSWLKQYSETPPAESNRLAEAQAAVRSIGAQKALPRLLDLVKTRDNRARSWLVEQTARFELRFFNLPTAPELRDRGAAGFEVLGTNAAPAVGELTKLLDDTELAFIAVCCLDHIGKPAESALCQSLTNQNWMVRRWAVSALASVTDNVEVYIARIKDGLTDAEPGVRFATVEAIGVQADAPELAVPLLISALADAEDTVCAQAGNALVSFGTNSASAFVSLTNLAATGRIAQVRAALKALPAIAPTEAVPVLSNAVVNGSPAALGTALSSLKSIAPTMALDMTLAALRASESERRLRAMTVVRGFDVKTPGLADAIKSAAADPDPEVARRALMTMREMLKKQKERSPSVIELPNEPGYAGKPLGEWLKLRQDGWKLSTDVVEALRQMGTNLIPALLTRLTYREPVFGLYEYDVSMEAVGALISLKEDARPALPMLAQLMDSDDAELALRAMLASLGTGTNAVPCLMKGLTSRFADVRNEAAHCLTDEWSAPFPEVRQQASPLLRKLLNDPDQNVRMNVTNGLKELRVQN